jgi:hypothetical protein
LNPVSPAWQVGIVSGEMAGIQRIA